MSNIASALKTEIGRVARKSIKQEVGPLHALVSQQRHQLAALRRQLVELQREVAQLRKAKPAAAAKGEAAAEDRKVRFGAKGLRAARARLGLSAGDFGKLLGVSGQTIYNWETEATVPRQQQKLAIAAIRGIGKREAQKRLAVATEPTEAAD